jgi:hypothetical protein
MCVSFFVQVSWSLANNSLWLVIQQRFRYSQLQALYFDSVHVWSFLQDARICSDGFTEEEMNVVLLLQHSSIFNSFNHLYIVNLF